jgi:esterase
MKLNHFLIGQGAPLVILHGLLGSLDNWMPHAQLLATRFRVHLLDLRNHGRSPHAAEFNYEVMAADVAEFVRDQNLDRVMVLGHSMGGKVAMRFAQLYPALTHGLVIADMAPREYAPRYGKILEAMAALDLLRFQQRNEIDAALLAVAPEKNIRQFLLKNIGRDATGGMIWKPNLASLLTHYPNVRAALPSTPSFGGPTLFIRGGQSDYIGAADVASIPSIFPQADFATIAAAGHWVHADAPEEFLRLVTEFLSANP